MKTGLVNKEAIMIQVTHITTATYLSLHIITLKTKKRHKTPEQLDGQINRQIW